MLQSLAIRNVVLIEKLDIEFQTGLCVLTGETGAGKSILLDSLGLALGLRAEQRLVGKNSSEASVTAVFDLEKNHKAILFLEKNELECQDEFLYLRRKLGQDGRSRAFINDQPVSISMLRTVGETLVEFHGQFESRSLMDEKNHGHLLDMRGGYDELLMRVADAFEQWQESKRSLSDFLCEVKDNETEQEFLRYSLEELNELDPKDGEEEKLATRRQLMLHAEKLTEALDSIDLSFNGDAGVEEIFVKSLHKLSKLEKISQGEFYPVVDSITRALEEVREASSQINKLSDEIDSDRSELEWVEERLFALRKIARKHGVEADNLSTLREELDGKIVAIENKTMRLEDLERNVAKMRDEFSQTAKILANERSLTASELEKDIAHELKKLKLGDAKFCIKIEKLDESQWNKTGAEKVKFHVSTNPGSTMGPLSLIASGGELARFMLALKVVLTEADPVPVLVFDEIDSGIGGATSSAVGKRLSKLAEGVQVLAVTHSPQVAAYGDYHLWVQKEANKGATETIIIPLAEAARTEEIARMLAGAEITCEARAAANSLLAREYYEK